ncbi:MAG TPA: polysaccharide deacetylase family protein [Caulobacteraceae bacterium]|jgi:peptidoglycan/xylan/chitin deacetylase (PgdA/CDA1 family)
MTDAYHADSSWRAKVRRRTVRLASRRPARAPERPLISFSFDDVPATAAETGAAVLEARGLRGTFYVAAALTGTDAVTGPMAEVAAINRLAAAGHEIGCHTYSHLDCGQAAACDAVEDVALNAQTLIGWGLPRPATFAYPFGDVAPLTKRALASRFGLMRALHHGLVIAGADLNQAPAVGVEGPDGETLAMHWLERAATRHAWLILCTHDVAETPSDYGCTPGALARIADRALDAGFQVVTVAEGARRVGSPMLSHSEQVSAISEQSTAA